MRLRFESAVDTTEVFAVYDGTSEDFSLLEVQDVPKLENRRQDMHRADIILDCYMLNVANIGGSAEAKVTRACVHPVKSRGDPTIVSVLEKLQSVVQGTTLPWLHKFLTTRVKPRRLGTFKPNRA
ncbi:MAG: nitrogen fixation protein NifX [Firmicutes bacterium]|jgi:nitrogen fixation protein NifX|uniref:Nitrogen fixation protein NifX n=1 Tax=Sulfobacillus benefaciens TaxID=453960 RepID=A0A2T2WUI8_9FIRM|nr:nitrogen fixation protein NifX [Bacillota bacterium]PSR25895.1 MAG: nitrogen fixation protein NifX [Sulfobacillus benefaciens]HBQ94893.1 nitrogen fixation protein NifX [Sulfobacillus sp.]